MRNFLRIAGLAVGLWAMLTTHTFAIQPSDAPGKVYVKGAVTEYYTMDVSPYPLVAGQTVRIRFRTDQKITKGTAMLGWHGGRYRSPLRFNGGYWNAEIPLPRDPIPGWHLIFVYLDTDGKKTEKDPPRGVWQNFLEKIRTPFAPPVPRYIVGD